MSTPHPGPPHGDHDADPTGMRDVLASLPDPAPMPQQLTDRICASLAHESQARLDAASSQPAAGSTQPSSVVHDFATQKAHRRPQQWIMTAAAVLAVAAIGTVVVNQILDTPTDASNVAAQANPESSDTDTDEAQAQGDAAAPAQEGPQATGIASLGDAAFALDAQALLSTTASETTDGDGSNARSLPDFLNAQVSNVAPLDSTELNNCAQAAGESASNSWLGLAATINGEEVVVLGDTDADSSVATQAWALESSCPHDDSAPVLKGPVTLP